MILKFRQFLDLFEQEEDRRLARILLATVLTYWFASLFVMFVDLIWWEKKLILPLVSGGALQLISVVLLLKKRLLLSSLISIGTYMLVTTALATIGGGIRDYVVMLYPIIIMLAGLTAQQRGLVFSTVLALLSLIWLIFGELHGLFEAYRLHTPDWIDLLIASVLIMIAAWAGYLLVSNAQYGLRQTWRELGERIRAEEALKKSQTRLQALTDATQQSFVLMDSAANILSFNRIAARNARITFGEDMQEGDPMFKFIAEQDRAQFTEAFNQALCGETVYVEKLSPLFIWQEHWVSLTYNPAHDKDGNIIGVCLNTIDVTERKLAEAALQNNERRLKALIENGLDYISLLDTQGNLLWENPSSTSMLGYRPNEFLGKSLFEIMHPDDLERISPQFAELAGEPGSRRSGVFRLRRSDGAWCWVEAIVSNFLHDPAVEALVVNYRDITERKQMEEAEREQRSLAEALSNSAAALNNTLNFGEVLDRVLDNVGRVVPHDAANIMLLDQDGDTLSIAYTRGYLERDAKEIASIRLSMAAMSILMEAAGSGQALLIPDTRSHPAWFDFPATHWVCSYLTVPIQIRQHTVGFLNLDSATSGFFNSNHAERLQAFANHAAIAIENARLYEQVQKLALTDTLTGTFNRAFFEAEVTRMELSRDFPMSIILADLDNMKKTNDTLGHAAGDELLKRTVQTLQAVFRASDIIARIGGDEFAVLLPQTDSVEAEQMLARVRRKLTEYNATNSDLPVRLSLGAGTAEHGQLLAMAFTIADQRLYADKAMRKSLAPGNTSI